MRTSELIIDGLWMLDDHGIAVVSRNFRNVIDSRQPSPQLPGVFQIFRTRSPPITWICRSGDKHPPQTRDKHGPSFGLYSIFPLVNKTEEERERHCGSSELIEPYGPLPVVPIEEDFSGCLCLEFVPRSSVVWVIETSVTLPGSALTDVHDAFDFGTLSVLFPLDDIKEFLNTFMVSNICAWVPCNDLCK